MELARKGGAEAIAVGAFVAPWLVSVLFLPFLYAVMAASLATGLAVLLLASATWSRARAVELELDDDAWAIAAVFTLGFSMLALLHGKLAELHELCHECGSLNDRRHAFCNHCGAY